MFNMCLVCVCVCLVCLVCVCVCLVCLVCLGCVCVLISMCQLRVKMRMRKFNERNGFFEQRETENLYCEREETYVRFAARYALVESSVGFGTRS
jgi:hypothetical protein